jgi:hypothetical protein
LNICGKNAKYTKNEHYYCEKHAKLDHDYIIPKKQYTSTFLRKLKIIELREIFTTLIVDNHNNHFPMEMDVSKYKKPELLTKIINMYERVCFDIIHITINKSANDIDLIQIGRNMARLLDGINDMDDITHVLIENQISPIATRMKTIQGMLAQYFIMKNNTIYIEFVSSSNKLKQFSGLSGEIIQSPMNNDTKSTTKFDKKIYKAHKVNGIDYCRKIINNNDSLVKWNDVLLTKKKDDLADSFLQGIWYLFHHNIILYADDLNIKFV